MADGFLPGQGDARTQKGLIADWPIWILLGAGWGFGLWAFFHLPSRVPMHWNIHGQVDRMGSPGEAAFLLPILATALYGLLLPRFWKSRYARENPMPDSVGRWMRGLPVALTVAFQVVLTFRPLSGSGALPKSVYLLMALFWVLLGNLMPRLEPNTWVGFRLPPTLESRDIWRATHRFAGRVFVVMGLIQVIGCWLPEPWAMVLTGAGLVLVPGIPIIHAYRLRRSVRPAQPKRPQTSAPSDLGIAPPLFSPFDLLGVAGIVCLGVLAVLWPIQDSVSWLIFSVPFFAWLILALETLWLPPGETRRACVATRGWVVLGLAVAAGLALFGDHTAIWRIFAGIAALLFCGLAGQSLALKSATPEARGVWGEGALFWDLHDPRIFTPKFIGTGWNCNFARVGSWILLLSMLGMCFLPGFSTRP